LKNRARSGFAVTSEPTSLERISRRSPEIVLERIGARRVLLIAALAVAVLVGTVAATNLASSTVYYMTPTEVYAKTVQRGQTIRLGGLVEVGSLHSPPEGRSGFTNEYEFVLTDGNARVGS